MYSHPWESTANDPAYKRRVTSEGGDDEEQEAEWGQQQKQQKQQQQRQRGGEMTHERHGNAHAKGDISNTNTNDDDDGDDPWTSWTTTTSARLELGDNNAATQGGRHASWTTSAAAAAAAAAGGDPPQLRQRQQQQLRPERRRRQRGCVCVPTKCDNLGPRSALHVADVVWTVCLAAYGVLLHRGWYRNTTTSTRLVGLLLLSVDVVLVAALTVRSLGVVTTRWFCGGAGVGANTNGGCCYCACGPPFMARVTFLVCGLYGMLMLTAWAVILLGIGQNQDDDNGNNDNDSNDYNPWCIHSSWCNRNVPKIAVPCVWTALFVVELLRSVFARGRLAQYYEQDHQDDYGGVVVVGFDDGNADEHSFDRYRHRPWWWSRHNSMSGNNNNNTDDDGDGDLEHPLLRNGGRPRWAQGSGGFGGNNNNNRPNDYSVDDGVVGSSGAGTGGRPGGDGPVTATTATATTATTSTTTTAGMFASLFGYRRHRHRRYDTNDHVREDGSVDYASLNEDWASRAEDDPYWWTRS